MSDGVRAGRDSPCVGVCNTLYSDTCQGCGRTAQEDSHWSTFTDQQKAAVWDRIIGQGWKPGIGIQKEQGMKKVSESGAV